MRKLILTLFILTPLFVPQVIAQTSPYTDYQYQLDQYRKNYAQFVLLKKDYLNNNTLDNEQKALLAVESTIKSRELTMFSFAQMHKLSILETESAGPLIDSTIGSIEAINAYYTQQAGLASSIQTKKDLAKFTADYREKLAQNQAIIDVAQVVNKVARLQQLNRQVIAEFDAIQPKLGTNRDIVLVQSALEEISGYQAKITAEFENTDKLIESVKANYFYRTEALTKIAKSISTIRDYEARCVDRLIDLDKNYVDR